MISLPFWAHSMLEMLEKRALWPRFNWLMCIISQLDGV